MTQSMTASPGFLPPVNGGRIASFVILGCICLGAFALADMASAGAACTGSTLSEAALPPAQVLAG